MQPEQIRYIAMQHIQDRCFDSAIPVLTTLIEASSTPVTSDIAWRGKMYFATGKYGLSADDYLRVLESEPDDENANLCLALIFAAAPDDKTRDGRRSLDIIEPILNRCARPEWGSMAVAAACHAECGDFTRATELIELVLKLTPPTLVDRFEKQLLSYQEHKPLRLDLSYIQKSLQADPVTCTICGKGAFFSIDTPEHKRMPMCLDCAKHDIIESDGNSAG